MQHSYINNLTNGDVAQNLMKENQQLVGEINTSVTESMSSSSVRRVPTLKKVIKKRVRNRYGPDPSYMGFEKHYMVNEGTGRANQLFRCLKCHIQTPKLCNMIDHQKTHRQEKSYKCPHCRHAFIQAGNRDRHYMSGACMIEGPKVQCPLILDDERLARANLEMNNNNM